MIPRSRRPHAVVALRTSVSGWRSAWARGAEDICDFTELKKGQKIGVMVGSFASMVLGKAGKCTSPYAFQSDMMEDTGERRLVRRRRSGTSLS